MPGTSSLGRGVEGLDLNAEVSVDDMSYMDLLGALSVFLQEEAAEEFISSPVEDNGGRAAVSSRQPRSVRGGAIVQSCSVARRAGGGGRGGIAARSAAARAGLPPRPVAQVNRAPRPSAGGGRGRAHPTAIESFGASQDFDDEVEEVFGNGNQKGDFDKAVWTSFNDNVVFCDLSVEQIRAGNRNNGTMTTRAYNNIAAAFYVRTGLRHSKKQLKSRWDQLKSLYSFYIWCTKQSGLRQTPSGGIIASEDFWEKHTKKQPERRKLRHSPPECLEDLTLMFQGIAVDGSSSCIPREIMGDRDFDDENNGTEERGDNASPMSIGSMKRASSTTVTSPRKRVKSPLMNSSSSSDDDDESSSEIEDNPVDILDQWGLIQQFGTVSCMFGTYFESTFMSKTKKIKFGESGYDWVMRTLADPTSCFNMFRMSRELFYMLHDVLVSSYGLKTSKKMPSVEPLAMFLWIIGAPQSIRQAENRFERSTETVSRKFEEVLHSVFILFADIIKPKDPEFRTIHSRLQSSKFSPHFDNCIGAIDGMHIPVVVPSSKLVQHTGRHGYTSQNVLAICDFDMRFTFAVAGWPGSVHDTRVFNDAISRYSDKFPHPPEGKFYLVDSGYPNRLGYLAPYRGTKYHLPEFRNGPRPSGKREHFNYLHSSLRNVIERSFGVLKMKWRILLDFVEIAKLSYGKANQNNPCLHGTS